MCESVLRPEINSKRMNNMQSAIIVDFRAYQKRDDTLSEQQIKCPSLVSDELSLAIQLLIERLRTSGPLKQTG